MSNQFGKNYVDGRRIIFSKTSEARMAVVTEDGMKLRFIDIQTYEVCLAAARQNIKALDYIRCQAMEQRVRQNL